MEKKLKIWQGGVRDKNKTLQGGGVRRKTWQGGSGEK